MPLLFLALFLESLVLCPSQVDQDVLVFQPDLSEHLNMMSSIAHRAHEMRELMAVLRVLCTTAIPTARI